MKSYVVVGLGYGDEGKGATVDFLCDHFKADCVVKYSGGHQAGHRVVVGGKEHVFAQYGAGAIAGVPTYLDRDFIIEPMAMLAEREALLKLGANVMMSINQACPVTTRYHRAFNRLSGAGSTCGLGVGATRFTDNMGIGLRVRDVFRGEMEEILRRIRSYLLAEAKAANQKCHQDEAFMEEMNVSPGRVASEIGGSLWDCMHKSACPESGTIVFEGSQGVLLDETYGDRYATYSTVTTRNAFEFPGFDRDNATVVGVMRTYVTRHGAGPFVPNEVQREDENNKINKWQGMMRQGQWGKTLYLALDIAKPDVLAVNHCDQQRPPHLSVPVLIEGLGPDRSDRVLTNAESQNYVRWRRTAPTAS